MKRVTVNDVLRIINSNDNMEEITEDQFDANLTEMGMNSITFIQIVVALEEEFECEIPDTKLLVTEMDTIQKIVDVLQSLYDEKGEKIRRRMCCI